MDSTSLREEEQRLELKLKRIEAETYATVEEEMLTDDRQRLNDRVDDLNRQWEQTAAELLDTHARRLKEQRFESPFYIGDLGW